GQPRFIPGSNRLLVSIQNNSHNQNDPAAKRVEVWRIAAETAVLEKTILGVVFGRPHQIALNGRISFSEATNVPYHNVYDVESERFLFQDPPQEQRMNVMGWV